MSENAKQTSSDDKKKDFRIRPFTAADYPQMREIYEQGLNTGHATYETRSLTFEEFKAGKIMPSVHVAVEDSIYLGAEAQGRGIGGALLDRLIEVCQDLHKWAIHSWIFPENAGSAGLHKSRGFVKVGTYSHMAKMTYGELAGQWRDTDVYELLLPKPEEKKR